jgi:hypothetical protein
LTDCPESCPTIRNPDPGPIRSPTWHGAVHTRKPEHNRYLSKPP